MMDEVVWPVIVALVGFFGSVVAILAGLGAIRRDQRATLAEATAQALRFQLMEARLERIGAYFADSAPGEPDRSLPTQVRELARDVAEQGSALHRLDEATREHMSLEADRWAAESDARQRDSAETRTTLDKGLQRVHDRVDAIGNALGDLTRDYLRHEQTALDRDRRIDDLEAAYSKLTTKEDR